jgi:hypothetical protein
MSLPRMSSGLLRTMGRREHYPSPDQGLPLRIGYSALALMGGAFFLADFTPPAALTNQDGG